MVRRCLLEVQVGVKVKPVVIFLEADLLEAIIALPTDMFYNTGIATYVWVLSNKKDAERKGKVHLINATSLSSKMRKSLGSKRNYLTDEEIRTIYPKLRRI